MAEVVSIIVENLIVFGVCLTFFFGFKYWIDKGGIDKVVTKCNDELNAKNQKLKKELEAYKSLNKNFEFLLKEKQKEVENLYMQIEALQEDTDQESEKDERK